MKKIFLVPLKTYQYISKMLPASCRYYPSCSEYAKWQFEFNSPTKALFQSTSRILRCNQLFKGGIDYPVVHITSPSYFNSLKPNNFYCNMTIEYWLVPKSTHANNTQYYVLKDFNVINTQRTT